MSAAAVRRPFILALSVNIFNIMMEPCLPARPACGVRGDGPASGLLRAAVLSCVLCR